MNISLNFVVEKECCMHLQGLTEKLRLTQIFSWNETKWGLFFNLASLTVYTHLPSILQYLELIGQKSHQQNISSAYRLLICLVGRVFANGPGDLGSIPGWVIPKTFKKKWYLLPLCLTLSNIRYISRVKWSNPGKGVAHSPTTQCSSYWKGSLQVGLDYIRQLDISLDKVCNT